MRHWRILLAMVAGCVMVGTTGLAGEAPAKNGAAPETAPGVEKAKQEVMELPFVAGQPTPEPREGGVWCLVTKPAEFTTTSKQVESRPATSYQEFVPAVYEMREERIMVEPAKKKEVYVPSTIRIEQVKELVSPEMTGTRLIPAEYGEVDKVVEVAPARTDEVFTPAVYEAVQESIEVEPARKEIRKVDCKAKDARFVAGGALDQCYATVDIPARRQLVIKHVLKEEAKVVKRTIPAVTKTIRTRVELKPARTETYKIPAEYTTVSKTVEITPAHYEFKDIPAQYETIRKLVQVKPASTQKVDIPAEYRTVTSESMVKPAQLVWIFRKNEACKSVEKKYGSVPGWPSRRAAELRDSE